MEMAGQAIQDKLTGIFREILGDPTLVLRPAMTQADIAGWDSFNNASLIAAIEKEFGVRFRTAELQELKTVGNYFGLLRAKLAQRG
jgi:acyl carrier protein